jgi:hypothetical protein
VSALRPGGAALLLAALAACSVPPVASAPSGRAGPAAVAPDGLALGGLALEPLFNGQDLSGWVPVNAWPDTWRVQDGVLVCTGRPTGVLRSPRPYENFVLELEWQHVQPGGNSGLFVWSDPLPARGQPFTRAIEVQVMDGVETADYTSHGDIFSIQGAHLTPDRPHPSGWERCLPSARVTRPAPEWNHYRVVARDGAIRLAVNGVVVSGGHDCAPRKGYLCLEAEGSEVRFRNLRLAELPPSGHALPAGLVADEARPFRSLLAGNALQGWSDAGPAAAHWSTEDWTLTSDGAGSSLRTEASWGDIELVVDWRWTASVPDGRVPVALRGVVSPLLAAPVAPDTWQRARLTLRGQLMTLEHNGQEVVRDALQKDLPPEGPLALLDFGQPVVFGNLYVREL